MKDENTKAFLRVLDPHDNSTGGGTASAVAGAMATALVAMVARLSIGKTGMEQGAFYQEVIEEAESLSRELSEGGREDSEAFDAIRLAFRLPKETEQHKNRRRQAIQAAMIHAARVPLANARRCARTLELAHLLTGRSNPNTASDLECGLYLARAGLRGCVANVKINLPGIKDQAIANQLGAEVENLIDQLHLPEGHTIQP